MQVTYGFHDILSRGADFHCMMSKLNVICKVRADLALLATQEFVSHNKAPQSQSHRWNSKYWNLSQACPRSVPIHLPKADL